ncbi:putative branched-chain amino acid transport ATP-binding protein LivG [uncultured archaeon]|nr:putative branched-chain amino acid transport ATP-binding protein LivG [uncultured archaeon]
MDDALEEHLHITAEKGVSRDELQKLLLKAGWPAGQVSAYIQKTFKTIEKGVIIRVAGISKKFGENAVLDTVDFDINRGEIFGLIGMSGAGKTTLLNLIVGFLRPDQGDIMLVMPDGTIRSVIKNPELIKEHIGFSTQTPSFYEKLTVRENLEHFARLYHITEPDLSRRCNALIELAGLKDAKDVLAAQLSGGMQKRLDIACALIPDPSILILDEPTADLDPILRKQFWELIKQINVKGTTILLASHFLAEIELLCSRIAILQNKRIAELGTADELRNIYSKDYEIYLEIATQDYSKLLKELDKRKRLFTKATAETGELVIETPTPEQILPLISTYLEHQRGMIQSLHVARPTLGKVFEAVVKR